MRKLIGILLPVFFSVPVQAAEALSAGKISWQPWSEGIFARAGQEHRLVILDLEAVWCHWCHVMERETYSNPEIAALIRDRFLPVRVDQGSRPDLANRYRSSPIYAPGEIAARMKRISGITKGIKI